MKTIADLDRDENIVALIYGAPGAGKTWLAGTFPDPVFIDTDFGMKVFKNPEFRSRYPGVAETIQFESFEDETDEWGLFKKPKDPRDLAFFKIFEFINDLFDNDERPAVPGTVVFDSITMVQVLAMHVGLELAGQPSSGGKTKSKTLATARTTGKVPVAVPTQADYGSEMAAFEQFMNQAIKLPANVLFLAHERDEYRGETLISTGPYLIGSSIRAQVARWFDEVWYLDVAGDGTRQLRTNARGVLKSIKSRHGIPDIEDPDYEKIKEAMDTLD